MNRLEGAVSIAGDAAPALMDRSRRLVAEALGTAFLLAAIVGSGIMAARLAGGNVGLALLANALAPGAALVVLITILAPVSGAHLNPAVSLLAALRREIGLGDALAYAGAQIAGGVAGVLTAHAMFDLPLMQASSQVRGGPGLWLAEIVATFGLVLTIRGCVARAPQAVAWCVGLYIVAAYWFTASTSFANPAVTLARALSDTFAGIAPADVPAFLAAQIAGALLGEAMSRLLWPRPAFQAGA